MSLREGLVAAALTCLAACGSRAAPAQPKGSLSVMVGIHRSATTAADVDSIHLTLTGPGSPAYSDANDLLTTDVDGKWTWAFHAPIGSGYTLDAKAYQGSTLLYQGTVSGITVAESMATVIVLAQQVTPPSPYANTPPRISGVYVSSRNVAAGDAARFSVTATDPDQGSTLSYSWTDDGSGDFATVNQATTVWRAHRSATTHTSKITVDVTDDKGAKTTFSFEVSVSGAVPEIALGAAAASGTAASGSYRMSFTLGEPVRQPGTPAVSAHYTLRGGLLAGGGSAH
jgi:hypothetical protein